MFAPALLFAAAVTTPQPQPALVVADGIVIATITGRTIKTCKVPDKPILPTKEMQELHLIGSGFTRFVKGIEIDEATGEGYRIDFEDDGWVPGIFLVGGKPAWPRQVTYHSPNSSKIRKIATDWLAYKGYKSFKPTMFQAVEVDLDGDGKNELLVEANTRDYAEIEPAIGKDISMLMICYDGFTAKKRETIYLSAVSSSDAMHLYGRLRSIVDMNGDGKFEVVTSLDYYEGSSTAIWNLVGGKLKNIAEMGSGV